jgi:DNA invertase Pin-like site-specific DNA recombinase
MKHVIGYVRVSTDEQGSSGLGLDAQRDAITSEAERKGWAVEFKSDVASGKNVNPGLREALDLLASGQADALVIAKMDRVARSSIHAMNIIDMSREQGWALVVLDMGLDMTTSAGRAMARMLAVFAEFERDLIGERTEQALAARRARGLPIGRPRLAPADVVRRIVTARDSGESFGAIARALTDDAVLTPKGTSTTWQESSVRRIYNATQR